jgi:hypothetical protein
MRTHSDRVAAERMRNIRGGSKRHLKGPQHIVEKPVLTRTPKRVEKNK